MLNNLSFSCFHAYFRVVGTTPAQLPEYTGSRFRGAIGHAMRQVRYGMKPNCRDCPISSECRYGALYEYLFESPADHPFIVKNGQGFGRTKGNFPQPFVLNPPEGGAYAPGEFLRLSFTLIGNAIAWFPFMVCALECMAHRQLGKRGGWVRLAGITDGLSGSTDEEPLIYDGETGGFMGPCEVLDYEIVREWTENHPGDDGNLRIRFLTPFRFQDGNRLSTALTFHLFMRNVFRRLTLLSVHSPLADTPDYQGLLEKAGNIRSLSSSLTRYKWRRYSARQNKKIRLDGVIGDILFSGEIREFLPYVRMCEFLNVGKGGSFGLGRYVAKP